MNMPTETKLDGASWWFGLRKHQLAPKIQRKGGTRIVWMISIYSICFFFWKRKYPFNSTDFPYFFTSYQHPFSTWISPTNTNPSHPPADSHHLTLSSGQSEAKRAAGTRTPWTWVGHHGSWTLMDLEFAWFLGPWLKWMLCQLRENHGWDSCVCTNEMGGVVWWDVSFIEVVVSWVWVGRC